MSDAYLIDGHKLSYHPRVVVRWMRGEEIYPLYVEVSPTGACNQRCLFCALDYLGHPPRVLDAAVMRERFAEMGRLGVKSVMFGGEGEPLLHKDIAGLAAHAKRSGIDVALTTNGVLLSEELAAALTPLMSWIKVSLDAGTASTYALLHGARDSDFELVLDNIARAARAIASRKAACVLGVQAILLPENAGELERLAVRVREAGADYLVIKPYSQHGRSRTRRYARLDYGPLSEATRGLQGLSSGRFQVVVRTNAPGQLPATERGYDQCLALPFWAYVDSGGGVWACSAHLGDERFRYGSLCEQTFAEIWAGQKRRGLVASTPASLESGGCRKNCRMNAINRYLWGLRRPPPHVNFI